MFTNTKLFSVVFLAASVLGATTSSSSADAATVTPAGVTTCIISCSEQAAASEGCDSFADLNCVCTNLNFQAAANACLQANCTAAEFASSLALQDEECAHISGATFLTSTAASSAASSGASSASVATSSSPAVSGSVTSSKATTSGSSTVPAPSSSGSAVSSPASSSAAAATTSSSAGTAIGPSFNGVFGLVMAVGGVLAGAAFIL